MLFGAGDRLARFLQQLNRLLVHAQHGIPRIVGPGVDVQHFLHARGELGVGLGRDDPILDLPVRHPVFFSVRRTVSWLTDSTISSATACSANSRNVQLANPLGGWPSRNAMILASCSPSRTLPRTLLFGLPLIVTSNPSTRKLPPKGE